MNRGIYRITALLFAMACSPNPADEVATPSAEEPKARLSEAMLFKDLPGSGAALGGTRCGARPAPGGGNAVTFWNDLALQFLEIDPGALADSRAFAIMHAAIHDAVNAVGRRYQPYTADLAAPGASVDAAVAAAAHDVLAALAPSQAGTIEPAYAAVLATIPDGTAKDAGVTVGRACAQANLARRASDGLATATEPVYVPTGEPGDYDFTPPFDTPPAGPLALYPGWGRITPFVIEVEDHRVPGPDRLRSLRYALDLLYLSTVGRLESPLRTAEQTEIAKFWFEGSPTGWNRIASDALKTNGADLWDSARILALVNFALADGYIAGFAEKYRHRFWRPYTAIRRAGSDGNPLTRQDSGWLPLFSTQTYFIPPVPDYPSTHTVLGASAAEVLIESFGDTQCFCAISGSLPGVTRCFDSFTQAAVENGLSRVYGGIHFVRAVVDGYWQGKGIGRAASSRLGPATPDQ